MSASNPYSCGHLVKDPAMFFGREGELKRLQTCLTNMQSASIVGMSRIGKSSLLYQLVRNLPDKMGQNYVPVYVDLQDPRYQSPAGFLKSVVMGLSERMGGILAVDSVRDMSSFFDTIDGLGRINARPVLCLDKFEEFVQRPKEFSSDFLEALRALCGQAKLAMVTASRESLSDLVRSDGQGSPFANIFQRVDLGLLEPDAAQALRREPLERQGIRLSQTDDELVQELGGRHPFFLQMACHYMYEALGQSQDSRADVVRESFGLEAESHFERLWNDLSAGEKATLDAVTGRAARTDETERVLKHLERRGVVEKADGDWAAFSTAFASYVKQLPVSPGLLPIVPTPILPPRTSEVIDITPTPGSGGRRIRRSSLTTAQKLLLFGGVGSAITIVAALICSLVPGDKIPYVLVVAAAILLFALVGVDKLTGRDLLQWFSNVLGKLFRPGGS